LDIVARDTNETNRVLLPATTIETIETTPGGRLSLTLLRGELASVRFESLPSGSAADFTGGALCSKNQILLQFLSSSMVGRWVGGWKVWLCERLCVSEVERERGCE
jgi:hypothetical protein